MLFTEKEAKAIAHEILLRVKADDAEVSVSTETASYLRFARNAFLTSGTTVERSASITVWIDGKRGSASTGDFGRDSIGKMVAEAEKVAAISPVDREYVKTLGPQKYTPVDGYSRSSEEVSYKSRAESVASILASSEKNGVITAGFHQSRARARAFATRNGNFGYEKDSVASLSVTSRTSNGSSSGYFQRSSVGLADLDVARIAETSIRKCLDGRGSKDLGPGVYPVILEAQAVDDLLGRFPFQFNARSASEGRSPFSAAEGSTKLGEKVFDSRLNVLTDPWNPMVPGSSSAQDGIPAERFHLVRNGVVENLVYNRFWAHKNDKKPTPGPVNTIIESSGPAASMDEMISSTKRGLLISRFWYIRSTDPRTASVTGLTRDGVWLIENGKIRYPVNNFRFNQSMIDMLAEGNVESIGVPERVGVGGASLLPPIKLKTFNFTSRSEAV